MKIILIDNIKKLGKKNDVVEVKDGFGTYLINNKLAVLCTDKSKEILNRKLFEIKKNRDIEELKANKLRNEIEKKVFTFPIKTGENGKVFGSITNKQISEKLIEKGYKIDKKSIKLDSGLNILGHHQVKVELYNGIIAKINIELVEEQNGKSRTK